MSCWQCRHISIVAEICRCFCGVMDVTVICHIWPFCAAFFSDDISQFTEPRMCVLRITMQQNSRNDCIIIRWQHSTSSLIVITDCACVHAWKFTTLRHLIGSTMHKRKHHNIYVHYPCRHMNDGVGTCATSDTIEITRRLLTSSPLRQAMRTLLSPGRIGSQSSESF